MVVHVGDELLNYPLAFSYNNTLTSKVQQDSNVLYLVVGPTSINDRVLQARKTILEQQHIVQGKSRVPNPLYVSLNLGVLQGLCKHKSDGRRSQKRGEGLTMFDPIVQQKLARYQPSCHNHPWSQSSKQTSKSCLLC